MEEIGEIPKGTICGGALDASSYVAPYVDHLHVRLGTGLLSETFWGTASKFAKSCVYLFVFTDHTKFIPLSLRPIRDSAQYVLVYTA